MYLQGKQRKDISERSYPMVQFMNSEHEKKYYSVLARMRSTDCYHRAVAYLFTLDKDCARHINDVFDFKEDAINPDGLHSGWQTGTSVQTTRLAFNLWNGFIEKGEEKRFTPNEIFTSTYANYYFEAIKLRYPEHEY